MEVGVGYKDRFDQDIALSTKRDDPRPRSAHQVVRRLNIEHIARIVDAGRQRDVQHDTGLVALHANDTRSLPVRTPRIFKTGIESPSARHQMKLRRSSSVRIPLRAGNMRGDTHSKQHRKKNYGPASETTAEKAPKAKQ